MKAFEPLENLFIIYIKAAYGERSGAIGGRLHLTWQSVLGANDQHVRNGDENTQQRCSDLGCREA